MSTWGAGGNILRRFPATTNRRGYVFPLLSCCSSVSLAGCRSSSTLVASLAIEPSRPQQRRTVSVVEEQGEESGGGKNGWCNDNTCSTGSHQCFLSRRIDAPLAAMTSARATTSTRTTGSLVWISRRCLSTSGARSKNDDEGNGTGRSAKEEINDEEEEPSECVSMAQATPTADATPDTQGFYDNVVFEQAGGSLPRVQPKGMQVDLLPFQQEGVAWMIHREQNFTGGIMADHLGMGKTVQMIGLCIAMAHPSRLNFLNPNHDKGSQKKKRSRKTKKGDVKNSDTAAAAASSAVEKINMPKNTKPLGYRIITVLQQMLKISAVGNCSRLTRPGRDLFAIMAEVEKLLERFGSNYETILKDLDPWVDFCHRYHPAFARRARAFLADEHAVAMSDADTPELRTLVILPASLILQWKSELEKKVKAGMQLSIHIFHGPQGRNVSVSELESCDIVLTSYETVAMGTSEHFHSVFGGPDQAKHGNASVRTANKYKKDHSYFDREHAGPLFQIKWKRIILDEAHMVRHSITRRWKAVNELQSVKRWVVTATPLHNSIEDLQNLLQFVNSPRLPVIHGNNHESMLKDPLLQRSISRALQPLFLRRGPVMLRNGQRKVLVELPAKTEKICSCELTDDETMIYNDILLRSQHHINNMAGDKKTLHLFAMMTRLRQTCCHPWLGGGKAVEIYQCGICKGEATHVVVTKCGHSFCHDCLMAKFNDAEAEAGPHDHLPEATQELKDSLPASLLKEKGEELDERQKVRIPCPTCDFMLPFSVFKKHHLCSKAHIDLLKKKEWTSSAKLEGILESIRDVLSNHGKQKLVLFSHFTSFLDIIGVALEREQVSFQRLDGTMTLRERNVVIEHFGGDHSVRVLLASKMAIGVGLNLTMANHVIVVDPWWNPAIEEQAVHRCHRIGQVRPVYVKRFIVNATIEQYCYDVCQRKKDFGDAVLKAATSDASERDKVSGLSRIDEIVGKLHTIDRSGHPHHSLSQAQSILL